MFKVKRLYREEYTGEEVTTSLTYEGGKWDADRAWIPNGVTNARLSTQCVVIGGGKSWQEGQFEFDASIIENHKGGQFGLQKLQIYGTNSVYSKVDVTFLVIDDDHADRVILEGITGKTIVYAHAKKIIENPGKFYLIPQDPPWNAGTIATYLACFDGHRRVFLMGFDGKQDEDSFYEQTMAQIFKLYNDVEFVRVAPTIGYYMPESWKFFPNVRQIDFRGFVLEADLG